MVLSVFAWVGGGSVFAGGCWRVGVACVGSKCWRCVEGASVALALVWGGAVCVWLVVKIP